MTRNYTVKECHQKESIFNYIHLGTNLPVLDSFKKYIYHEIDLMGCFSLVFTDNQTNLIIGHSLLYQWEEILYFAFFYAKDASFKNTRIVVEQIERKATELGCTEVLGPVNLPPFIYGFGFSEKNSEKTIFAAAPYTDPAYIQIFQDLGYISPEKLLHFRVPFIKKEYKKVYDLFHPDLTQPSSWKFKFLEMANRLFPSEIQVTPNRAPTIDDMIDFHNKFSDSNCFFMMRYPESEKIIGIGWGFPNPFDLKVNGKAKSYVFFGAAVEKEHQKSGVITQNYNMWSEELLKIGATHGEGFTNETNYGAINMFKSWNGVHTRTHVLMHKQLVKGDN